MNFENKLISGVFIKRYKRFFVDIKVNRKTVIAHCPNTGSMMGLLKEGNKVDAVKTWKLLIKKLPKNSVMKKEILKKLNKIK